MQVISRSITLISFLMVTMMSLGNVNGQPFSDFEDGTLQGWTRVEPFYGGLFNHTPGGNPGKFMRNTDTMAGGGTLQVEAPSAFTGNLSVYAGIVWDEYLYDCSPEIIDPTFPILVGIDGTIYRERDFQVGQLEVWVPRFVPFYSTAWELISGSGTASFEEVLQNVAALRMNMEISANESCYYEAGIDNISLSYFGPPTIFPAIPTECPPVVLTECPVVLTECPEILTECPVIPTECPVIPTECPVVPTECPEILTECPVIPTECPEILTECPEIPTECPVNETLCPNSPTWCPLIPTECPVIPTECPVVVPTECPVIATECPEIPTECPEILTECPVIPTECPEIPTECPEIPTECPEIPTECPEIPTECPEIPTECPHLETECPISPTGCPVVPTECPNLDRDGDGLFNVCDNCDDDYNPLQEDSYPPGGNDCGDACECEGNFDGDLNQDADDASIFQIDFGRTDCTNSTPCNGDFDCDGNVDEDDQTIFLSDFGRSEYNMNPCPTCATEPWCVYTVQSDSDDDGIYDDNDNCPNHPNGPLGGTCTSGSIGDLCVNDEECGVVVEGVCVGSTCTSGNIGAPCDVDDDCDVHGFCSMNQEDTYPSGR